MRVLILVSFLTVCSLVSWSQDTTYVYFDEDWKKTKKKEHASYLRKFYRLSSNEWRVEDYFINGVLKMEGNYTKKNLKTEVGKFVYYYENGQKEKECVFKDGNYHGESVRYYEDGGIDSKGMYESGLAQGDWIFYFKTGQVSSVEKYKEGKMESFQFYDTEGKALENAQYEVEPEFPGGQKAMALFIQANVVYPEKAAEMGITGMVYVQFVVAADGSIELLKVSKSVHPLLDNEAMRVVKLMPTWSPGKLHNRPVRVRFTLPIKFGLR
jgi:TonB family protein